MSDFQPTSIRKSELSESLPKEVKRADYIHRYPAKMTPKIASYFLEKVSDDFEKKPKNLKIFDPFCGSGTSLLVARSFGYMISGIDILKVPVMIARAKLTNLRENEVKILERFSELPRSDIEEFNNLDEWEYRNLWFKDDVYSYLMGLRKWIKKFKMSRAYPALFTALSQVVWNASAADPGIIVPTRSKRSPKAPSLSKEKILEKFKKNMRKLIKAQKVLDKFGIPYSNVDISVGNSKDASTWPVNKFDIVLTSPPYGDGIDYRRAVSLQTRFFGFDGGRKDKYTRKNIIGRTTHNEDPEDVEIPAKEENSKWIKSIQKKSGKRLESVLSYIHDIRATLKELRDKINFEGKAIFVIGNPEVTGYRLPLARILVHVAEEEGWGLSAKPVYDSINKRRQTPIRRSSNNPITKEYILQFTPG